MGRADVSTAHSTHAAATTHSRFAKQIARMLAFGGHSAWRMRSHAGASAGSAERTRVVGRVIGGFISLRPR